MAVFKENPFLGHITTFGGNPVSCAASLAVVKTLLETKLVCEVPKKEARFREGLNHPKIIEVRGKGLLLSVKLDSFETVQRVMLACLEKGLVTDWFLFDQTSLRVAPPLIITMEEIDWVCETIVSVL